MGKTKLEIIEKEVVRLLEQESVRRHDSFTLMLKQINNLAELHEAKPWLIIAGAIHVYKRALLSSLRQYKKIIQECEKFEERYQQEVKENE